MKSNRYENGRGEGGALPSEIPHQPVLRNGKSRRCHYVNARNHQCLMVPPRGSDFCLHHDRLLRVQQLRAEPVISEDTAATLLAGVDFSKADKVKLFLQRLVEQIIRGGVGRRDAVSIAYLCQLSLNCQSMTLRELRDATAYMEAQKPKPERRLIWDLPGPPKDPAPKA